MPGARVPAERGELAFGTVDTFLLWRLTGGSRRRRPRDRRLERQPHAPLRHPPARLGRRAARARRRAAGRCCPRSARPPARFGETAPELFGRPIPITALAGDQQAATFGQACFEPGQAKNTYGTGAFLLAEHRHGAARLRERPAHDGRLAARAGRPGDVRPRGLGLLAGLGRPVAPRRPRRDHRAARGRRGARGVASPDTGGVYLVPGVHRPRRAVLGSRTRAARSSGITRGHRRSPSSPAPRSSRSRSRSPTSSRRWPRTPASALRALRVDGGAAANDLLLQLQADLLGVPVERPVVAETTALGAAYLAGLAVGYWDGLDDIASNWALDRRFEPSMSADRAPVDAARLASGGRALAGWIEPDRRRSVTLQQSGARQIPENRLCSGSPNVAARP